MKRLFMHLLLLAVLALVTIGVTSCFDREPMHRLTAPITPAPPESTWVEVCDTTWTSYATNTAQVNTTNRTATRIEGFTISCNVNLVRYGAIVTYSDTYDQTLKFFLEKLTDANVKFYLADSLGRTSIPQPQNYSGKRYMMLTTANIPPGQYGLKMYYAGTVSSPTRARPTSVYSPQWHVDAPCDTLKVGCIDCRLVKVPK